MRAAALAIEHRTAAVDAVVHPTGWAPFAPGLEVTRLPLVDRRVSLPDGRPVFARLTYRDALAVAAIFGARLPTAAEMDQLHLESIVLAPCTLPAGREMISLAYSEEHDAVVWAQLEQWDRHSPVAGAGKHWIAGAPAGRAYLMGWWVEHVERYSQVRRGPGWIQVPSPPGSAGPHDDQHHDYGTTTLLVRAAPPTGSDEPGRGILSLLGEGIVGAGRRATAILRAALEHDGAEPPPTRKTPMQLEAELPCVTRTIRARGYRPMRSKAVRVIVLHTAECGEGASAAEQVAGYFATLTDRTASAHFCIDSDSIVQCVPLDGVAWAAPGANDDGVQIELAGRAGQGVAGWCDAFSVAMLDRAATLVAQLCARYGLPAAFVDEAGLLGGLSGITTHAAVSRAFKRSTHQDPGPSFPLAAFLDAVRARI